MVLPKKRLHHILIFCLVLVSNHAITVNAQQDYDQDYGQDNLYHDYAMRQEEKEAAATG